MEGNQMKKKKKNELFYFWSSRSDVSGELEKKTVRTVNGEYELSGIMVK